MANTVTKVSSRVNKIGLVFELGAISLLLGVVWLVIDDRVLDHLWYGLDDGEEGEELRDRDESGEVISEGMQEYKCPSYVSCSEGEVSDW